jgi:dihydropteroate synthase
MIAGGLRPSFAAVLIESKLTPDRTSCRSGWFWFDSMTSLTRTVSPWKLRTRSLEPGRRTLVMGVINITPDSFSDGGLFLAPEAAAARALQLFDEGADLIDLGAESTRPGSQAGNATEAAVSSAARVSTNEEQARLLPVIEAILAARPDAILSADTYKSATARAALAAGVEIINDVSGFCWDKSMSSVCAQAACGVVLMHTRGRPDAWLAQEKLPADALIETIRNGLSESYEIATRAGIAPEAIVLDPGYGFGKKFDENYTMLARQAELLALGRPLLAGVSRKSFLGRTLAPLFGGTQAPIEARQTAGIAALVAAILHGASIVRVHDVRPAVEAARIADAILAAD